MTAPRHTYRYPPDRYERAKARAQAEGTTVTEIICARLDEYVDEWIDKMRALHLGENSTVVTKVEHHPPLEVQHRMFGDAIDQMVATGQATQEEAELLRQTWTGQRADVTIHDDAPYEPPTGPLEVNDLVKATLAADEPVTCPRCQRVIPFEGCAHTCLPDPACTALIGPESKPCPCARFEKQKQSENRCGQCGHLKGLHQ